MDLPASVATPLRAEDAFRTALRAAAESLEARRARLDRLVEARRVLVYSYGTRGRDLALQLRGLGVACVIFDNAPSAVARAALDGFETAAALDACLPVLVAAGQNQAEILAELGADAFSLAETLYAFDLRNAYDRARAFTDTILPQADALFAQQQALDPDCRADFQNLLLYRASLDVGWLSGTRRPVAEMWTPPEAVSGVRSFCDVGAYDGDTLSAMKAVFPGLQRSFTVEPNPELADRIAERARSLGLDNTNYVGGAWRRPARLAATWEADGVLAITEDPHGQIAADTLDNLTRGATYDLVKLDIEATEASALEGATALLQGARCIAIAAYHLCGDLLDLPRQLRGILGEEDASRWNFRHYSQSFDDSIFYVYR